MARTTEMQVPAPAFDARQLWDMNDQSLEFAERTYRGLMNGALRLQNEAIDFWRTAAGKNWAAASDIAACATAAEAIDAQSKYMQECFTDIFGESQKIAAMLGEIMQENVGLLESGAARVPDAAIKVTKR